MQPQRKGRGSSTSGTTLFVTVASRPAESTLSFLGLGVLALMPSWGAMRNDARSHLFDAPHLVVFPAMAVMTAVLAFNLLGDALRDWMDPRTRAYLAVTHLTR